jgi:myo-inositol-1(or 4)-monophosphatase
MQRNARDAGEGIFFNSIDLSRKNPMHPMLNTAVTAARRAGALINRASFDIGKLTITSKRPRDFVSEVDRAAEEEIIRILRKAYPDHAILAEESGAHAAPKGESEYQWIIDPLDGTTNFLHGLPQYCVSIGLLHRGIPSQAVVFDPTRNELFTASRGRGAFLNDTRIRCSKTIKLGDALIGTGFPFRELKHLKVYIAMFEEMTRQCAGVRRPGSAALDLCYVGCGRYDGFWEIGLSPWDMAAGALIVRESGALIGDLDGGEDYLASGRVLAGTPKIYAQMISLLEPFIGKLRKA